MLPEVCVEVAEPPVSECLPGFRTCVLRSGTEGPDLLFGTKEGGKNRGRVGPDRRVLTQRTSTLPDPFRRVSPATPHVTPRRKPRTHTQFGTVLPDFLTFDNGPLGLTGIPEVPTRFVADRRGQDEDRRPPAVGRDTGTVEVVEGDLCHKREPYAPFALVGSGHPWSRRTVGKVSK